MVLPGELAPQRTSASHVNGLIDRFEENAHLRLGREVDRQASANLIGTVFSMKRLLHMLTQLSVRAIRQRLLRPWAALKSVQCCVTEINTAPMVFKTRWAERLSPLAAKATLRDEACQIIRPSFHESGYGGRSDVITTMIGPRSSASSPSTCTAASGTAAGLTPAPLTSRIPSGKAGPSGRTATFTHPKPRSPGSDPAARMRWGSGRGCTAF